MSIDRLGLHLLASLVSILLPLGEIVRGLADDIEVLCCRFAGVTGMLQLLAKRGR